MDYLIVFVGGVLVGLLFSYRMKLAYIGQLKQLKKELELPKDSPPAANPYAKSEAARAKYRTMWGPLGENGQE